MPAPTLASMMSWMLICPSPVPIRLGNASSMASVTASCALGKIALM